MQTTRTPIVRRTWTRPRVETLSTIQAESGFVANGPEGLGKGS